MTNPLSTISYSFAAVEMKSPSFGQRKRRGRLQWDFCEDVGFLYVDEIGVLANSGPRFPFLSIFTHERDALGWVILLLQSNEHKLKTWVHSREASADI